MIYLFWFVHLACGALTDARMWGKKDEDAEWVAEYTDVFWLGYFTLSPLLSAGFVMMGAPILSIESVIIGFGMSAVWDLIYCKAEFGRWIHPLPLWLIIPNPFSKGVNWYQRRIVIGFNTVRTMGMFHLFRFAILLSTLFF